MERGCRISVRGLSLAGVQSEWPLQAHANASLATVGKTCEDLVKKMARTLLALFRMPETPISGKWTKLWRCLAFTALWILSRPGPTWTLKPIPKKRASFEILDPYLQLQRLAG